MELNHLLIADYANVDREGKLNVMGIFNRIYTNTFPAQHPEMRVIISLLATPAEAGRTRHLEVKLIDEDGNGLLEWETDVDIPQYRGKPIVVNQILKFVGVTFPTPGEYAFNVLVDGDDKGTAPIYVEQRDAPRPNN